MLANPQVIETSDRLNALYTGLGFATPHRFLVFLGVAIFCVVFFGLLFRTFTHYVIYRFVFLRGYTIGSRLLAATSASPTPGS